GAKHISVFHARIDGAESEGERRFCKKCGTALWVWDPRWPDLIHPFASCIDSDLPVPPQHVHMMLGSKANWVEVQAKKGDTRFDDYPDQSLEDWHKAHRLLQKV
ncbi:MAG TPA: GFA family protein, partial [Dongiaceae bacterium]|nr:GFA family protein [Dongiaceae bacterium]